MDRSALDRKMEKDRRDGNVGGLLKSYREGNLEDHLGENQNNELEHATLARPSGPRKSKKRPKKRVKPKFGVAAAFGGSITPETKKVIVNTPSVAMKKWVNSQISSYPVKQASNFTSSWQDGVILTALVDSMSPGICPLGGVRPSNPTFTIKRAMDIAEKELGVPQIMESDDMANHPDSKSCMTYISYFTKIDAKAKAKPAAAGLKSTAGEYNEHRKEGEGMRSFVTKKSLAKLDISPREKKLYDLMFDFLDKDNSGKVRGDILKPILMSSKLPRKDLQAVWRLADMDNSGELSRDEFYIAMKMIALAQQGKPISLSSISQNKNDTTTAKVDLGSKFDKYKDDYDEPPPPLEAHKRDAGKQPPKNPNAAQAAAFRGSFGHNRGASYTKNEEKQDSVETRKDDQGREFVDLGKKNSGFGSSGGSGKKRRSSKFSQWGKALKNTLGVFNAEEELQNNSKNEKLCPQCSTPALLKFTRCKECGHVFGGDGLDAKHAPGHYQRKRQLPKASSTHKKCPDCGTKCELDVVKCPDCRYRF